MEGNCIPLLPLSPLCNPQGIGISMPGRERAERQRLWQGLPGLHEDLGEADRINEAELPTLTCRLSHEGYGPWLPLFAQGEHNHARISAAPVCPVHMLLGSLATAHALHSHVTGRLGVRGQQRLQQGIAGRGNVSPMVPVTVLATTRMRDVAGHAHSELLAGRDTANIPSDCQAVQAVPQLCRVRAQAPKVLILLQTQLAAQCSSERSSRNGSPARTQAPRASI
eukprot:11354510-Alexandrium_andersonii.AAC.1